MSSTSPDEAQQVPSTIVRPEGGASDQLLPAKREHDDEVQFISSQPIKKMRLVGDGQRNEAPATEASAPGSSREGRVQAGVEPSMSNRCVSAMPLGLPSHLSADPLLENRGSSLPTMENFSFPTSRTPTSARPVESAAVSPKQIAQTVPPGGGGTDTTRLLAGPVSSPQGMTIDQVSCLDVREPLDSSIANSAADVSDVNNAQTSSNVSAGHLHAIGTSNRVPSMPTATFRSLEASGTNNATSKSSHLQLGYVPPKPQVETPFAVHSAGNLIPFPHIPQGLPSVNSFRTDIACPIANKSSGNGGPSGQQTAWTVAPAGTPGPDWSTVSISTASLQHPRPIRPTQVPLNAVISGTGTNPQSNPPRERPCLACMNAREQGRHAPTQSQTHSHGNVPPSPSYPASWAGGFGLQSLVPPPILPRANLGANHTQQNSHVGMEAPPSTSVASPAYAYPQFTGPGVSGGVQTGPRPQFGHGNFMPATASASAQSHSGVGTRHVYGEHANTMISVHNPVPTPSQNANENLPNQSTLSVPRSTATQPTMASSASPNTNPWLTPPTQPQPQPQPRQRPQAPQHQHPHPQQPQAPPPGISSATTAAAAHHASARKRHAANLLVDVAELAGEIFPYDVVARQHGTLPRKVAEALAAVVQVPLLRCATDKRRAGKLGSERMKEFREARKGWVGLVREWEREEKERERDAEGETDDERSGRGGNGAAAAGAGKSAVGPGAKAVVDPRAPVQPGEPSALDVALMLPPAEMPGQMLRDGFFTGPW